MDNKKNSINKKLVAFFATVSALLIVIVILLVLLIGAISENNKEAGTTANQATTDATFEPVEELAVPEIEEAVTPDAKAQEPEEEETPKEEPEEAPIPDDNTICVTVSDCYIQYIGHEIVENMSGDTCLAVYYEFTNNSSENELFSCIVDDTAFQSGIEMEHSMFHVNEESKLRDKEIQPGTTVTVCSAYVLRDMSDVEIQFTEWLSFDGKILDSMVITME